MHQLKITTSLHGQMDSSSRNQLHSFFKKIGGIFGKDLADAALPEIQHEVQRHVAAHCQPIRFMSVADFCAKPIGSSLFGVPDDLSTLSLGVTMRPVESSSLRRVGYNSMSRTLRIEFKAGGVWEYLQVPRSEYEKLMKAESPGGYFYSHIRNRFQSRKIP
jgi:lysyl-tRNA synthetase class 2